MEHGDHDGRATIEGLQIQHFNWKKPHQLNLDLRDRDSGARAGLYMYCTFI